MKEKIYFKTFGCRTNIYDTELLKSHIKDYEIINDEKDANIIVINSCTVTNGADSGTKAYINSMQDKGVKIVLTGCGLELGKKMLEEGKIFGLLAPSNKAKINSLLLKDKKFTELGDLKFKDTTLLKSFQTHTKAFVKIQEGCDFNCSYCIIPSVRGKSRSLDEAYILKQCELLLENGHSELVLTGTNIGSYGLKEKSTLGRLLQKIFKLKGLKRLRLGSLEPSQIDESFKEILDESILERHLHIALQHTSDTMLKIMKRRSKLDEDKALFAFLREKGFALGTDFIVAHPGESEAVWKEALNHFKDFKLTHIHAFIFSPRKDTASALMKNDIQKSLAKERLHTLRSIVKDNNYKFRQENKDRSLEVLIEQKKEGYFEGYDQFYNKFKVKSEKNLEKTWLNFDRYQVLQSHNENLGVSFEQK